jgi:YD repeat-containing protein
VNIGNALPAGTNNLGSVNIGNALPAGSNTIGSVNIGNALPAGTNNLGSVNIGNWIDGEISATEFRVVNTFTGAAAGDVIALITTFDVSVEPPTSSVTNAINVSSMTALSSIPDLEDLVKLGEESYTMTYAYDANDNLITETRTLGDISQSRTYEYDANDNLESRTSWTNI